MECREDTGHVDEGVICELYRRLDHAFWGPEECSAEVQTVVDPQHCVGLKPIVIGMDGWTVT